MTGHFQGIYNTNHTKQRTYIKQDSFISQQISRTCNFWWEVWKEETKTTERNGRMEFKLRILEQSKVVE
jgi:hypothetical protein